MVNAGFAIEQMIDSGFPGVVWVERLTSEPSQSPERRGEYSNPGGSRGAMQVCFCLIASDKKAVKVL